MANLAIDVPPYVVWRSRVRWPSSYAAGDKPSYDPFTYEPRLELLQIMKSSSVVGPSYATVRAATGVPHSLEIQPEDSDGLILARGDRVAIGQQISAGRINWLWGGYVTTAAILIDKNDERMTWKLVGPEWLWGVGGQNVGGDVAIYGQFRRESSADDLWQKSGDKTPFSAIRRFSDLVAVFNPDGRANMTIDDVTLNDNGNLIDGRVWEEADRQKNSDASPASAQWDTLNAARTLCTLFNRQDVTNIAPPPDWTQVAMKATDVLREVRVESLCLYDALKEVFGSRFAFYVDPRPKQVNGATWGPFNLYFFSRSRVESTPAATFYLNARGTTMAKAIASVNRIEAARDVAKLVNRVVVGAKFVRHVRLIYWGGATSGTLTSKEKSITLQQAWQDSDGKLNDFAGKDDTESPTVAEAVNEVTVTKDGPHNGEWEKRYVTTGVDHLKYANVFRRFTWNESNELPGEQNTTYGAAVVKWFIPDLSGIADVHGATQGKYARRRRPLIDSIFLIPGSSDKWQRLRPTLYIASAKTAIDKNFNSWTWRKVPESAWQLDRERAAFVITHEDIASWRPFEKQDKDDVSGTTPTPNDPRTFATLMRSGKLRLCLEGSIEVDYALECEALPTSDNGSAQMRETFIRTGPTYVRTLTNDDGFTSPSQLTPAIVDQTDAAQAYADLLRDAGQEQKVNASISVEGDFAEQVIGAHIQKIGGTRTINLASGPSGRGAQIVAVKLDIANSMWEYLTESAALALAERDRRRLSGGTRVYAREKDEQRRRHEQ